MNFYLWIESKQKGPYEPEQIREALSRGTITTLTLVRPEDGSGNWSPINNYPDVIHPPEQPDPPRPLTAPASPPESSLPEIEHSGVATALTFIAMLGFVGAFFGGILVGIGNPSIGRNRTHELFAAHIAHLPQARL